MPCFLFVSCWVNNSIYLESWPQEHQDIWYNLLIFVCLVSVYWFFFYASVSHCCSYIDKSLLWYLCHILNMDMGMIIKSIVAKRVWSALNNEWARMWLNLPHKKTGQVSLLTLTPLPTPSPPCSLECHYSGRSFCPLLDIIQCNHPSIKNLLVIKGTTRVNTQNMEKDDPAVVDSV